MGNPQKPLTDIGDFKMSNKKKSRHGKRKPRARRSKRDSHWKLFLTAVLKIVIFPIYVVYVFCKTLLVDKPKEAAYAVKECFTTLYEKSKNGYRRAKRIGRRVHEEEISEWDDLSEEEYDDERPGFIMRKVDFVNRTVFTVGHFVKKGVISCGELFIKCLHVKRTTQRNLKWSIRTSYGLWNETGKVAEKLKNSPSTVVQAVKNFVIEAIEDEEVHLETQPPDQSNLPEPISLEISQELITTQDWPNDDGYPSRAQYSRKPISRGRSQTRQTFSQRIEGTIPARKFFAPPTNEELIDDYFSTYDAIQPHDPYRRMVYSKSRRHHLISETDAESMDVNPRSGKIPEYDEDQSDVVYDGVSDENDNHEGY